MQREDIPATTRPLFQVAQGEPSQPTNKPEIVNRVAEAKRVIKRLSNMILEHRQASFQLGVEIGKKELSIVFTALRNHASGEAGFLELTNHDEIQSHCLNRLFEELVEEPSNILYATPTGPDSIRYDAMDPSFWVECLDLLEKDIISKKSHR